MGITSFYFLCFFALVLIAYYTIPLLFKKRGQWVVLLFGAFICEHHLLFVFRKWKLCADCLSACNLVYDMGAFKAFGMYRRKRAFKKKADTCGGACCSSWNTYRV